MKKNKLAIKGGKPVINYKFKKNNTIGNKEINAVTRVMKTGNLSGFYGSKSKFFWGGEKVRKFERMWSKYFKVKYAISVNSWTSGLVASIGALGLEPGDEIIVSPWTMCASATAIIHWNCIPVFADIEPKTFCIDPKSVEKNISKRTKAIVAVDIFGQCCNYDALKKIARKYNLKIICDSAQSILAKYKGKYSGILGDIGGYSLNYHKHINTGEGGVIVTNKKNFADKLYAIRNHAEAIASGDKKKLANMIGHNFRMGEIEAAIGIEQLKKVKKFVQLKRNIANLLNIGLKNLPGLSIPKVRNTSTHSYYIYPLILDLNILKVSRKKIVNALRSEGVQGLIDQYINLHLYPMYQKKIAYGSKHFPWSKSVRNISYSKGICPVAEELQEKSFIGIEIQKFELKNRDVQKIVNAFKKVWLNINDI